MTSNHELTHELGPRACVVRLSGDLDIAVVPELRRELVGVLEGGCANLVLDLSEVDYADSTALGLLVWLDHRLRPAGGRLVLAGANRDVSRILELSGLAAVASSISTSSSLAEALEGLELGEPDSEPLWEQEFDIEADVDHLSASRSVIADSLRSLGLPEAALFDVKVALGEALANAIRHGAPTSGKAAVRVRVVAFGDRVVFEVTDNGPGFNGAPKDSDDLYAPGGRGVMFMRALMDRVEYGEAPSGGTLVRLTKHRAGVS
ncbi:MAG: anti-sigma factor antagonist [Coriobacteriia bacterium]|nr:anti-sigma factor antagonist [Coriobacteriia bacterium]